MPWFTIPDPDTSVYPFTLDFDRSRRLPIIVVRLRAKDERNGRVAD
jgi:hypothetical protein